jgi:hypothetical protein
MFLRQEGAERQPGCDRLGDGDDVRHHAEVLEGEDLAGAAEAALNLVEDERGLMLVGERPAGAKKIFGTLEDSAFAKDGFEHDGAGVGIDGSVQASMSFCATKVTFSRSGSKPLRYLSCPVRDMAPNVRP